MGRTLPSITQQFDYEIAEYQPFKRAMKPTDQQAFDDLVVMARKHMAEAAFAAHAVPMETFLLSMLLEIHKEVLRLRDQVEQLSDIEDDNEL